MRRVLIAGAALILISAAAGYGFLRSVGMFADAAVYSTDRGAIDGYDPVAYFELGAATPGSEQFTTTWREARWLFANSENLAKFRRDPERYAPAYGGYCAYGMASGYTANTDPEAWTIVDDRLFLNFDHDVKAEWETDRGSYIAEADVNWPSSRPARRLAEESTDDR